MKTRIYTEQEVTKLVQDRLKNLAEIETLKDLLHKEGVARETAVKKYNELCESCIRFYITERQIETDAIFVQVNVPRFMPEEDFETALVESIKSLCLAEREKHIHMDNLLNTMKTKE